MKKLFLLTLILSFTLFPYTTALGEDSVTVHKESSGYQRIVWTFTTDASGAASVKAPSSLYGMLYTGQYIPSLEAPAAFNQTFTVTLKPVLYNNARWWSTEGTTLTVTSTTPSIPSLPFWPTNLIPTAGPLQIDIAGALTEAEGPSSGTLVLVVAPGNAGK